MLKLFQPTMHATSIERIPLEKLTGAGIRGLILDLDNTVTPWNHLEVEPKVAEWLTKVKDMGIKACVVSNNKREQRVAVVADHLGIPFVFRATKPRRRAFLSSMALMETDRTDTAVIGDQLFTDILGGNRLGLLTILVTPISEREFFGTKVMRYAERALMWLLKKTSPMTPQRPKLR